MSALPRLTTVALVVTALAMGTLAACKSAQQKRAEGAAADPMVLVGKSEQERAAPAAFAPFLADKDPAVRARAVVAVARLEVLAGLAPLLKAMSDVDGSVRAAAAFGLGQLDLAIDPKISSHQGVRNQAEKALVDALKSEAAPATRIAIVRALGRIADGPGLDALTALAAAPSAGKASPERAEALLALGVAGKRRAASRSGDPGLVAAASAGLVDAQMAVKTGAAYAVFQQKLKVSVDAAKAGYAAGDGGAQARIYLMRSAPNQDEATAAFLVDAGVKDADWRVKSEALRAAATRPQSFDAITAALDDATAQLLAAKTPSSAAAAHVVRSACAAVAAGGAGPSQAKPALEKALVTLAKTSDHRGEACACAVALDIIDPAAGSIERCDVDANDAAIDRLRVAVIAGARTSSAEKVPALAKLLKNDDVKVRMAAADALTSIPTRAGAEAAAARLADEEDFGVISTLIDGPLADSDNADLLGDSVLFKITERLKSGTSFEQVEPLVTVATLVKARNTPTAKAILTALSTHGEPRVRDAAAGVPQGERAPGPRASVVAAPPLAELPTGAIVKTSRGTIHIAFDREHAASNVANFAALVKAHFYEGTPFHRVIADFVAQGGDKRGDGAGGPGYTIACENSDERFTRGAVGIATSGKDTGGSQFFFTHSDQPHLDGRYTLFARVVEGLDVMDALQPNDTIVTVALTK